jgi:membrane glycosyltransferase
MVSASRRFGRTLLARLQQFAGGAYGASLTAGLAWWTGSEGNYWYHNAILRMAAFAETAGLPRRPVQPAYAGRTPGTPVAIIIARQRSR